MNAYLLTHETLHFVQGDNNKGDIIIQGDNNKESRVTSLILIREI